MARPRPRFPTSSTASAGTGGGRRFALARFDPAAKPFSSGNKARDKAKVAALAARRPAAGSLLRRPPLPLLVVLQGTDTAGKDGTIRGVFGQTSVGRARRRLEGPTPDERAHDYLWRIHRRCRPRARSSSSTAATTKTCWCPR